VRSGAERDVVRVTRSSVVSVVVVLVSSIVARDRAMGSLAGVLISGVKGVAGGNVGSLTEEFTFLIGGMTGVR